MSPVFAARRRAEEFQAMVETSTDRGSDARLSDFLEIVETLRDAPPVSARPEFVAELREQLLDEARTAARTSKGADAAARLTLTRSTSSRRRERRLAAAIGGLAIVGATTGMAVASQSALPGDPLYPLKRAIENAQTGVQVDDDAKGKTLLDNASGRLEEVDQLSRESSDADAISDTLQTFTDQADEASELLLSDYAENGKEDSVEQLREFTADSMTTLTGLEGLVPEDARASLIKAAQTLTRIDEQALLACPSCGPDLITQIPALTNVALDDLLNGVGGEPVQKTQQEPKSAPANKEPRETGQQPINPDDVLPLDNSTPGPDKQQKGTEDDNLVDDLTKPLTGGKDKDGKEQEGLLEGLTGPVKDLLGGLLG
ncbi:MAG TPA: DUF5667 domain-containing protein [Nocardioides sp.]|nr:DUF5667 domain-containing protein [Nocardioides sp.]